jgi:hypothetical protein
VLQSIDCVVTLHNGVEIQAQLVITPFHGSDTVGHISEVHANGSGAEVAKNLLGKNVNLRDRVIYLLPYTATYRESADQGPSP